MPHTINPSMGYPLFHNAQAHLRIYHDILYCKGFVFMEENMEVKKLTVSFDPPDMHFLKKYGLFKAASMARKHYKKYNVPFINDTYQLSALLHDLNKNVFNTTRNINKHYKRVVLNKRNGGKGIIHAPDAHLKFYQRRILEEILYKIPISEFATAYVPGKKLKSNAEPHINHKYLLKMDITDFFGSITYLQVISSAFNSKMYPTRIGAILTSLCCKDDVLPQGAPTSPMLSNIVMKNFDDILGNWCKDRNITYTRYCDDLTFSADFPLYNTVYAKAGDMLNRRGFEVNESKTKFISNASCQMVTGLTVNEKVSVPRDYKRKLRQEVYYAIKFGIADSIVKLRKMEFWKTEMANATGYYNHLCGKINYVLQIEPQNKWFADALVKLKEKYESTYT